MLFNPDPTKQATEVCSLIMFFNKPLTFNNNKSKITQKHAGLYGDSKLDFNQHNDDKRNKCNKIIGTMRRLSMTLSKKAS